MKAKNFWDSETAGQDPFDLSRRIATGIAHCADSGAPQRSIRYLWVFVTEENARLASAPSAGRALTVDEWLNVIDESAALGAEWLVIHAGTSISACPNVWRMCEWAQTAHGMRVGIHLCGCSLSNDDVEQLKRLDSASTYVVADDCDLGALGYLAQAGVQICSANIREEDRVSNCAMPHDMTCVGIDGTLYTCGLVLGDESYRLGSILERGLGTVISDASLPHEVADTAGFSKHGCDGCPPHVAHRVTQLLPH